MDIMYSHSLNRSLSFDNKIFVTRLTRRFHRELETDLSNLGGEKKRERPVSVELVTRNEGVVSVHLL